MSTTTQVAATLAYLVTLFRNATTVGGATPPVSVVDGPMPSSGPLPLALWVGVDDLLAAANGDPTTAADSAKTRDDMALGREETITIHCVAAAWAGDTTAGFGPLRTTTAGIVTAVETVVAADTGSPGGYQNPGVTAGEWRQRPLNSGLQVFVPFQIIYTAL